MRDHFQQHGKLKDTQALLRHTTPAVTLKHYQKTLPGSLVSPVANWDGALTEEKGSSDSTLEGKRLSSRGKRFAPVRKESIAGVLPG